MYRMCTVCTVLSYVHLIILAPFLLRTGPWTAISPAGIQLVYTVASKDKSSCILQKLKTVFVCPRQRWKVTVILLRSIVRNLQMALFLFLTSAIMQICAFSYAFLLCSALFLDDVIFMPVSANAFVEFIVGCFFGWFHF